MKNFLRVLRHALPYRRRLAFSIAAAFCAALLWGLNFTAIYPVLKLLHTEQSPHQWFDEQIAVVQKDIEKHQADADRYSEEQKALEAKLEQFPGERDIEKNLRDLAGRQTKAETRLAAARSRLWWFQVVRLWIARWCPHDVFLTLALVTGLVMAGMLIKCFFEFVQEFLVGSVVNLTLFDLRNRFYRNVIHLDVGQFGEQGTSELMARFTNDMEAVAAGLKMLFGKVVAEPLRALACITFAAFISWQLTLMFLVLVPIAVLILTRVGRVMKRATRRLLERMSSIYKILHESFRGIRVVKAFTMEPYERRRFCAATKDYYHKSMLVIYIDALADPIIEILGAATVVAALLAGSYLVLNKQTHVFGIQFTSAPLESESLLQLYLLLGAIADPVRKLGSVFTRLQAGGSAADRIFAYLDREPKVRTNSNGPRLVRHSGGNISARGKSNYIVFRDVCFSYEPGKPILSNINLNVRAGEKIAIVGKNGSGKTTLLSLLPRLYDPDHGSVLIDGIDLRQVHLRSLRQLVGVVMQEPFLFDDTIFNNIAYGHRGARPEAVEAAARAAFCHDFIVKLPNAYNTQVGEAGCKLSGGQKQRIALARTILRHPDILILDEFTSQYDAESEALIHKALREFMAARTTLMITHRMHTLEIADRIAVLDEGRLAAVGTHAELLASSPIYQRLHEAHAQRLVA